MEQSSFRWSSASLTPCTCSARSAESLLHDFNPYFSVAKLIRDPSQYTWFFLQRSLPTSKAIKMSICVLYVCKHAGTYECICTHPCEFTCLWMNSGMCSPEVFFLRSYPPYFWAEVPDLVWNSLSKLGWLASNSRGSGCLCLPSWDYKVFTTMSGFFRFSCLCSNALWTELSLQPTISLEEDWKARCGNASL